jgi:hypothetical protein
MYGSGWEAEAIWDTFPLNGSVRDELRSVTYVVRLGRLLGPSVNRLLPTGAASCVGVGFTSKISPFHEPRSRPCSAMAGIGSLPERDWGEDGAGLPLLAPSRSRPCRSSIPPPVRPASPRPRRAGQMQLVTWAHSPVQWTPAFGLRLSANQEGESFWDFSSQGTRLCGVRLYAISCAQRHFVVPTAPDHLLPGPGPTVSHALPLWHLVGES